MHDHLTGFMPNHDFIKICTSDKAEADAIRARHQLMSGWLSPSEDTVFLEFQDSAARARIDPANFEFVISKYVPVLA